MASGEVFHLVLDLLLTELVLLGSVLSALHPFASRSFEEEAISPQSVLTTFQEKRM